jgi:hypothetical protein
VLLVAHGQTGVDNKSAGTVVDDDADAVVDDDAVDGTVGVDDCLLLLPHAAASTASDTTAATATILVRDTMVVMWQSWRRAMDST